MKVITNDYSIYKKNINFGALNIKNEKKWNKSDLQMVKDNLELKQLVDKYDKYGIDLNIEYYDLDRDGGGVVLLSDSQKRILCVTGIDDFKYNSFNKSYLTRDVDVAACLKKNNEAELSKIKISKFAKMLKKFIPGIK